MQLSNKSMATKCCSKYHFEMFHESASFTGIQMDCSFHSKCPQKTNKDIARKFCKIWVFLALFVITFWFVYKGPLTIALRNETVYKNVYKKVDGRTLKNTICTYKNMSFFYQNYQRTLNLTWPFAEKRFTEIVNNTSNLYNRCNQTRRH